MMGSRCIICKGEAVFAIKGTSDKYCSQCAAENFSDLELLQRLDEQAKIVQEMVETRLPPESE